jgi:uncharacterized protein with HEPN domain
MSYREQQRLADIQAAIDAIRSHLQRGDLSDGLIFDAVRIRLLEIGEAVKALPDDLLATQPSIPWRQIARMRDHLAHRYFDTAHAILQATVDEDLPDLERAVQALTLPVEKKTQTRELAQRDRPSRIPERLPRALGRLRVLDDHQSRRTDQLTLHPRRPDLHERARRSPARRENPLRVAGIRCLVDRPPITGGT